jgi:phosphinothricin acetyltransferase
MLFRDAQLTDLPVVVSIYNSIIEGRMVTADMEPVTVADRVAWFNAHSPDRRPLWMVEDDNGNTIGWVSLQDFYGRPAYNGTAEISIYLHPDYRGQGWGKKILDASILRCKSLHIHSLLGFIFAHNEPSLQLFLRAGFEEWANLLDIAIMDGKAYSLKILGKKIQ